MGRRLIYQRPWYKQFEKKFVGALEVRFDMICSGLYVMTPEEFLAVILGGQFQRKYTPALAQVVRALDRRANTCKS